MLFLGGHVFFQKLENMVVMTDSSTNPHLELLMSTDQWRHLCFAVMTAKSIGKKDICLRETLGNITVMIIRHHRNSHCAVFSESVCIVLKKQDWKGLVNLTHREVHRWERRAQVRERKALERLQQLHLSSSND